MYEVTLGTRPLLIIAAHEFPHTRRGTIKPSDINTGQFALELTEIHSCYSILSTSQQPDPNWYQNSQFRKKVFSIVLEHGIKLVLDIHGRQLSSEDIVQWYPNSTCDALYTKILQGKTIKKFLKNEQLTICEELDDFGIPAIEIEIRRDAREPQSIAWNSVMQDFATLIKQVRL